jgi:alpha-galactosidase
MANGCCVTRMGDDPPVVRYRSRSTLLEEGLVDGTWVTRYWTADGRPYASYEKSAEPSFRLGLDGRLIDDGWSLRGTPDSIGRGNGMIHHLLDLLNESTGIRLGLHTVLDGTPVVRRWLEITNLSEDPIAITDVFPLVANVWARRGSMACPHGESASPFILGRFTRSDWSYEGWFDWERLEAGRREFKSDRGQGFDHPFFVLRNAAAGEYWIGHLAWSANWVIEFEHQREKDKVYDTVRFGMGPWAENPQRMVDPGETVGSPSIHLGCISGDLDSAVQSMHDHIRRSILPRAGGGRANRIQYSVPGDQGYPRGSPRGLDEKTLLENVDLAAALGAEVFIIDAGWWETAGEWTPSPKRFPRGLTPIIDRARDRGLLFGLYAELEGGRGNWEESEVYKSHPDWFGPKNVLNLANPEVASYVEEQLTGLIEQHELDLFRLDYNPLFTYEGSSTGRHGRQENNYWRYYEAFYSIFERIRRRYPELILQQAAAGGARNDLGTAGRFHESYLTDGLRVPHVLQVYSGMTLALPPEAFVIGLGADAGPARGHPMNLDTNLRTIFTLSTPWVFAGMVAPSLDEVSEQTLERFRHYAGIYRDFIRPILPGCRTYHHSPVSCRGGVSSTPWFAMEFSSEDRQMGWAMVVRMGDSSSDVYRFIPRGLDRGRSYLVTMDDAGQSFEIEGVVLMEEGLRIHLEEVGESELLLFQAR